MSYCHAYRNVLWPALSIIVLLYVCPVLPRRKQTCVRNCAEQLSPPCWQCQHLGANSCSSAQPTSGGQSCHPYRKSPTLLLLQGFQQISPVVEADPTLVAVCGAIGAADWLQVPWAGHPEGPILADAAGILAAINLGKQHNIGPKVSSCPERTNHAASHLPQQCPQLQPGGNPEVSF